MLNSEAIDLNHLDDTITFWSKHGPYTFNALVELVRECAKAGFNIDAELDSVAHKFPMPEFEKLLNPHANLNSALIRDWEKATCDWSYKGVDFHKLNSDQRRALSEISCYHSGRLAFLGDLLNEAHLLQVLDLACELAIEEVKERKAKEHGKRDKSPQRRKK